MKIIKKQIYNIFRNYLKRYFTGNLGKVVEEEDKLICYVKRRKCKRDSYTIPCFGIGENEKKLANDFKLNKPICYVIDGIKSERKKVFIFGYNDCEIIVKNCKFNWETGIHVNGKCTLENTSIRIFRYLSMNANEMTIKNMNLNHEMKLCGSPIQITIGADKKLNIIDSNIGERFDTVKVNVTSFNELNMINSKVKGNEIEVKSKTTELDEKSSFIALKKANIEIDDLRVLHIDSPNIILNGEDISEYGKTIKLEKDNTPLKEKRWELLKLLKKIRNNCAQINDKMVENYTNMLNNQSVSKVLKK